MILIASLEFYTKPIDLFLGIEYNDFDPIFPILEFRLDCEMNQKAKFVSKKMASFFLNLLRDIVPYLLPYLHEKRKSLERIHLILQL